MKDAELLELIEFIRQIPADQWELFSFIRSMHKADIDRIKSLTGFNRRVSSVYDADEDEDSEGEYGFSREGSSSELNPDEMSIDDFRRFL